MFIELAVFLLEGLSFRTIPNNFWKTCFGVSGLLWDLEDN